jgi:predicted  nucleic acid-binding Zn-ribbon protein
MKLKPILCITCMKCGQPLEIPKEEGEYECPKCGYARIKIEGKDILSDGSILRGPPESIHKCNVEKEILESEYRYQKWKRMRHEVKEFVDQVRTC